MYRSPKAYYVPVHTDIIFIAVPINFAIPDTTNNCLRLLLVVVVVLVLGAERGSRGGGARGIRHRNNKAGKRGRKK